MAAIIEENVIASIGRLASDYEAFLQELVRIPSPAGHEGPAQQRVARQMRDLGLIVDVFDVDPHRLSTLASFNQTTLSYENRPCVVGRLPGGGGGRSLMLNAHIDTVPVDAEPAWTYSPYSAVIADGRLYGRGACDDKAGVAECLLVAAAIKASGEQLAGDLLIAIVVEDERTGNGSLACVERGHTADAVIIVDGTWPERFAVSHLGQVSFEIVLHGVAGHATSAGPNPTRHIGDLIRALDRFVDQLNDANGEAWGSRERPCFVNVGEVQAGVWPGSVPAECVVRGQLGFPPPLTVSAARLALEEAVRQAADSERWRLSRPPEVRFVGLETPPEIGEPMNPIVQALTGVVAEGGGRLQESVILGHCDLRHYTKARTGATPAACLYGPGGGKNVHGADEYFELTHLPLVAGNLARVAVRWCGGSRG